MSPVVSPWFSLGIHPMVSPIVSLVVFPVISHPVVSTPWYPPRGFHCGIHPVVYPVVSMLFPLSLPDLLLKIRLEMLPCCCFHVISCCFLFPCLVLCLRLDWKCYLIIASTWYPVVSFCGILLWFPFMVSFCGILSWCLVVSCCIFVVSCLVCGLK